MEELGTTAYVKVFSEYPWEVGFEFPNCNTWIRREQIAAWDTENKTITIPLSVMWHKGLRDINAPTDQEAMLDYKRNWISLGMSDYAALTVLGCSDHGLDPKMLNFGGDSQYGAHVVLTYEEVPPPSHYTKVIEYSLGGNKRYTWAKVYDDTALVAEFRAEKIIFYRAGCYGCLIQLVNTAEIKRIES